MTDYKFIVNPAASRGKGKKVGLWLEKECHNRNLDFDLEYTTRPKEAIEIAKKSANNYKQIVAVGGDGTLQEVMNGILGIEVKLGIIPVGTGNDFARVVNVPFDPPNALDIIIAGYTKPIDVGKINNQIFHNGVGIGFDANVVMESLKIRRIRGQLVYLIAILKSLIKYKPALIEVYYNDKIIKQKVLLVTIGNGISLGGGIKLTPFAKIDDGLLDLNIIQDVNKLKVLQNLAKAYSGKHVNLPEVIMDKCITVLIKSEQNLPVHADGELISCNMNEVKIEIIPKAIKFVVPNSEN